MPGHNNLPTRLSPRILLLAILWLLSAALIPSSFGVNCYPQDGFHLLHTQWHNTSGRGAREVPVVFESIVKKIYRPPAIVSERCFETRVLGCAKTSDMRCYLRYGPSSQS
jgi:hypothetical protein